MTIFRANGVSKKPSFNYTHTKSQKFLLSSLHSMINHFRTKFPGIQELFSYSSMQSESLNFSLDIPRHWVNSKMGKKFVECVHIITLSWKRDLTKRDYNLKAFQDICYSKEH